MPTSTTTGRSGRPPSGRSGRLSADASAIASSSTATSSSTASPRSLEAPAPSSTPIAISTAAVMPPRSGASSTAATLVLSSDRRSTHSLPRPSETAVTTKLNAIVTLTRESALREARAATGALKRRSKKLGPLHGVPVTIKDLTQTKGVRTTWGSKVFEDHIPTEDALIVERLKAAGAIVLGKTNTPEFGAGGNTFNAVFGVTRNPWNPAFTCGGSSGGAAVALATGMGPIAQGSDTGGSLRTPAAFCGVVGFRTSPGLVPYYPKLIGWDSIGVVGPSRAPSLMSPSCSRPWLARTTEIRSRT